MPYIKRPHLRRDPAWTHGDGNVWDVRTAAVPISQAEAPYLPVYPTLPLILEPASWPGSFVPGSAALRLTSGLGLYTGGWGWMTDKAPWGIRGKLIKRAKTLICTGHGPGGVLADGVGQAIADNWTALNDAGYQAIAFDEGVPSSTQNGMLVIDQPFQSRNSTDYSFDFGSVWPTRTRVAHVADLFYESFPCFSFQSLHSLGTGTPNVRPGTTSPPSGSIEYDQWTEDRPTGLASPADIDYIRHYCWLNEGWRDDLAAAFAQADAAADVKWFMATGYYDLWDGDPFHVNVDMDHDEWLARVPILTQNTEMTGGLMTVVELGRLATEEAVAAAGRDEVSTWIAANL